MDTIYYFFIRYILLPILSFWAVLTSDPNEILRLHKHDKYRSWVIVLAKIKKAIFRL